jgi:sugar lactone lactonase YvrE
MLKPKSRFLRHRSLAARLAAAWAVSSAGPTLAADQIAYAELNSEYVRIDISTGSVDDIEPLSDTMIVGAFAGSDGSREYTADAFDSFISIGTIDAETSLLGQLDISGSASGMAWDPVAKTMILIADDASCENAVLYTLDITSGATQSVGSEQGCVKGLAIDSDENVFSIDTAANALVRFDVGSIGELGFAFNNVEALFFDWTGSLDLIATDQNTGLAGLYVVDTVSGAATLTAPYEPGYSAFALAPDPDEIFKNGFQANAGFH